MPWESSDAEETPWETIVLFYDALLQIRPSPAGALNRVVAVSMARGPAAGLEELDALVNEGRLKNYHFLFSVQGDFLIQLGRLDEGRKKIERAMALTQNQRERKLLAKRLKY